MSRIAKKSRSVNRQKPSKQVKPPRYTIRKDSLDRHYAIDKRTGKRVSVSKAEKERARRRKAALAAKVVFYGIKPKRPTKPIKPKVTRRKEPKPLVFEWRAHPLKTIPIKPLVFGWRAHPLKTIPIKPIPPVVAPLEIPIEELEARIKERERELGIGPPPEGRMITINGIADRAETYPKVKAAAEIALDNLKYDFYASRVLPYRGELPPPPRPTPRFDKHYGSGIGQLIRDYLGQCLDLIDVDDKINAILANPENDFAERELYTLYFSPEVA